MSWKEYLNKTTNKPANPLLTEALINISNKSYALDLGAGSLRDTKCLAEFGFRNIDAVDSCPETALIAKIPHSEVVKIHTMTFNDFKYKKNKYDLINAHYSLPFHGRKNFFKLWNRIIKSLKINGVFVGQFFGEEDEWRSDPNLIFHNNQQINHMFKNFTIIKQEEEKRTRSTTLGNNKYWHVFHIIAKKNK